MPVPLGSVRLPQPDFSATISSTPRTRTGSTSPSAMFAGRGVAGLTRGRLSSSSLNWIGSLKTKMLSRKKHLMLAGAGVVVLGLAAFYFFGNQASAALYLTARDGSSPFHTVDRVIGAV